MQETIVFSATSTVDPNVARASSAMGEREAEQRGAVNTRREVAEFILDLAGYTPDHDLHMCRILEPSFGEGAFLVPVVERLMEAYLRAGKPPTNATRDLLNAVRAVELHRPTYMVGFQAVIKTLERYGVSRKDAQTLAETWLLWGDFLLIDLDGHFTYVVGNPPYLRQEEIDDVLMVAYRAKYSTIYDRADLYVPFFERGLSLLNGKGKLGYICADRWMKNRYGGPLRGFVAEGYELDVFVDMNDTSAFSQDVIAYAAVFVISRRAESHVERPSTMVAARPKVDTHTLRALSTAIRNKRASSESGIRLVPSPLHENRPWQLGEEAATDLLRSLESRFPTIEEANCKVGIGVATGNNKVFVRPGDELPIEEERKLPMALSNDVVDGRIEWSGQYVLNPFDEAGQLIDLNDYPRTRAYLEAHATALKKRHVAKKNPERWYRTIDKIDVALASTPKLLIPDIKGAASVVYDSGQYYPRNNLYYVTSDEWDIVALRAVLASAVAEFFVTMYSVKMQGGFLRYQAQYLRRICLPLWANVSTELRDQLRTAGQEGPLEDRDRAAFELYGLDECDRVVMLETIGRTDASLSTASADNDSRGA